MMGLRCGIGVAVFGALGVPLYDNGMRCSGVGEALNNATVLTGPGVLLGANVVIAFDVAITVAVTLGMTVAVFVGVFVTVGLGV